MSGKLHGQFAGSLEPTERRQRRKLCSRDGKSRYSPDESIKKRI
jgi:hypothetical protein